MKKSLILKSQTDQVFLIINQFSLNPKDFVWEEAKSGLTVDLVVSKLFHSKTNYFFKFDLNKGKHCCTYSPGETKQADTQYPGSWELQINYFRDWLKYLKREIDSLDLWSQVDKENILAKGVTEYEDNLPFSPAEFEKIHSSLNELKEYIIKTQSLSQKEVTFLETRISYLEESSKRLGRKDWVSILIGVLANIIIGLALSPEVAKELFKITSEAFSWLLLNSFMLPK
jgi:hypothetical protein